MADMISAAEAKSILGCDDATLNNYINNGTIRAQRAGGQLQVSREDVLRLSSGSESDDGTLILASESDDFSIDLGEVVDDSAATMVNTASDDAAITFNDNDGLEMPDLDAEATQDLGGTTDATSDLNFTESNTAVVTSVDETMVDETMVDQTAADLQTVDYGDSEPGGPSPRRSSGRVSQRSVRSQRVEFDEEPVHTAWPVLMGLTLALMLFTIPYIYMMSWPSDYDERGEKVPGTVDNMLTNLASSVVGFSVEPDADAFKLSNPQEPHIEMGQDVDPEGGKWRYKQSLNGASSVKERLKHYTIQSVELSDTGKPQSAINKNNSAVQVEEVKVEAAEGRPAEGAYRAVIGYD